MSWSCYCLLSNQNTTYIGSTVNLDRRLRQHNREIVGGAKATGRAEGWKRVCSVTGFPDERSALQFEWKWKHSSRKLKGTPLERRIRALETLLNSEQSTQTSQLFSTFDAPLLVCIEDESCNCLQTQEFRYAVVESI
jgi:structure-specific endonuclease subunit SLX1